MTYWISRGNYARITAGMTPEQVAGVDAWFTVYPEPVDERLFVVDQERIGAAYDRLLAAEPLPLVPARMMWQIGGRSGGRASSWHAPTPWYEVAPGTWLAPEGTREPAWASLEDLLVEPDEPARRYFLNDRVTAPAAWDPETSGSPLDDMRDFLRRWREGEFDVPPPRQLRAGENALTAIAVGYPQRRGWPKDPTGAAAGLAHLTGIPIVRDADLPPNAWQLVDPRTGEVLYEGDISAQLGEYMRVMREEVEDLATRSGVPYDLLDPGL